VQELKRLELTEVLEQIWTFPISADSFDAGLHSVGIDPFEEYALRS
jgi:hypothetical protein